MKHGNDEDCDDFVWPWCLCEDIVETEVFGHAAADEETVVNEEEGIAWDCVVVNGAYGVWISVVVVVVGVWVW